MTTVTIREVQHNLAAYVKRVEQGEDIEIRRRDKVVARLVHAGSYDVAPINLNWGQVRERRQSLWHGKPTPGKPASDIVREDRGDR